MTTGWRHVYTWSRRGSLGAPGFQTVGRSPGLDDERARALERLVSGLRTPAGGSSPSLFLQPSPTDAGWSVLTRSVATGRSADGRPGGFVAESVGVPDRWLEASGWDLEAAFAALPWRGWTEGDGDDEVATLPDVELPPLEPPDDAARRSKLARLDRLLPDPELRAALLETLIWQAEDGGREEPVHLVPAPETPPEDFEALVLLLPLILRPEERTRSVEGRPGERRCLRLGTLAAPGALEAPDLLGVPDALLEEARRASGLVVDLGGRIPPPHPDERGGGQGARERARRASRGLAAGALEDPEGPGEPETVTSEEGTMADHRDDDPFDGASDPLAERAATWRLRDESEARAAALLDRLRADHDEMIEPLKRLVEAERKRFRDELDGLKRQLAEIAEDARAEIASEADRARQALQGEGERRKGVLRGQLDGAVEALDRYQEDLLRRLSDEEVRAERRLREAAGLAAGGAERPIEPSEEPDPSDTVVLPGRRQWKSDPSETVLLPDRRERRPLDPGAEPGKGPAADGGAWKSASAAPPTLRDRLDDLPAAARWAGLAVLAVLLAGAGWFLLRGDLPGFGPSPGPEAAGVAEGAGEGGEAPPADGSSDAGELRARAVERLRDGGSAAALLTAAAGSGEAAVRDGAAAAHLALRLGGGGLDDGASCALLQQVLSDRRAAGGLAPLAVDGVCGGGTQSVLANAAAAVGCGGASWQDQGACVVNRHLAGGDPPCDASWPLRRSCAWSVAEAERALAAVRRMPAELRAGLDLERAPGLASGIAGWELSGAEAGALIPLAWAAAEAGAGRPVTAVPEADELDAGRLRAALAYLERLGGAGA